VKKIILSDLDKEKFQKLWNEWINSVPDPATHAYENAKAHLDKLRQIYIDCHRRVEEVGDGD
jgi:hypothetical protein